MQNKLDKFENELKTLVDNFEPKYSTQAWSKLERSLPNNYTKWYLIAASVVIIAASFVIYQNSNSNKQIADAVEKLADNDISKLNNPSEIEPAKEQIPEQKNTIIEQNVQRTTQVETAAVKEVLSLDIKNPASLKNINKENQELSENDQFLEVDPGFEIIKNKIYKTPVIYLSTHEACLPLELDLAITDLPLDAVVNWAISDGYKIQTQEFNHNFEKSGLYKITAEVQISGKTIFLEDKVLVNDIPEVDFTYSEENGLVDLENKSENYEDFTWTFSGINSDEEDPSFEMLYSGVYQVDLAIENEYGCVSSLTKSINYKVNHHIFAPNAFSPDGDGVNDEFLIKYDFREGYEYTLQVFDAQGQKLFETQDKFLGWKAENINSNSTHGKFSWRLIIKDPRGIIETYKGFFVNVSR